MLYGFRGFADLKADNIMADFSHGVVSLRLIDAFSDKFNFENYSKKLLSQVDVNFYSKPL